MINISNLVFDTVCNAIQAEHADVIVTDVQEERYAANETVLVRETNNVPLSSTATDANAENHARISYEIGVYVNKQNGAKAEAETLMEIADTTMQGMKFSRTMMRRYPDEDRSWYRIIARYEVIARAGVTTGETTVFQMYRR